MRARVPCPADTLWKPGTYPLHVCFFRGHSELRQGEGEKLMLGVAVLENCRFVYRQERERVQIVEERREGMVLEKTIHSSPLTRCSTQLLLTRRTAKHKPDHSSPVFIETPVGVLRTLRRLTF